MESADDRFARLLHLASKRTEPNAAFAPPIVNTSVYALPPDPSGAYQYARWGNPTWTALEEALGVLEDAEVITFPSGMAAIAAVLYAASRPGDRLLLPADGYYTTRILAEKFLLPMGVQVDTCATAQLDAQSLAGYRLVMIETPSNPALDLADIAATSARAHAAGALVVVDNTTMTPLGQRPLDLGADVVVSADTKAVNGHSDVLFGHVATRDSALLAGVRDWRRVVGAIPGPFESWLVHRGLETLEVRLSRMAASAQRVAQRLAEHRSVQSLRYPGLPTHPQYALAQRQMSHGGTLVALTLADKAAAERFIERCPLLCTRWGDAVADGFIRLSIGCEPTETLWRALDRALET
jgi:cystathionine gamma-lyase